MLYADARRRVWSEFKFENPKAGLEKSEQVVNAIPISGKKGWITTGLPASRLANTSFGVGYQIRIHVHRR